MSMGTGAAATAQGALTEPACAQASVTIAIRKNVLTTIFIPSLFEFENFFYEFRGLGIATLPEPEDRFLPHLHRSVALCDLHQLPQRGLLAGLAEREDELLLDAAVVLGVVQLRQEINLLASGLLAEPENGLLPHFDIVGRAGDVEKLRPRARAVGLRQREENLFADLRVGVRVVDFDQLLHARLVAALAQAEDRLLAQLDFAAGARDLAQFGAGALAVVLREREEDLLLELDVPLGLVDLRQVVHRRLLAALADQEDRVAPKFRRRGAAGEFDQQLVSAWAGVLREREERGLGGLRVGLRVSPRVGPRVGWMHGDLFEQIDGALIPALSQPEDRLLARFRVGLIARQFHQHRRRPRPDVLPEQIDRVLFQPPVRRGARLEEFGDKSGRALRVGLK